MCNEFDLKIVGKLLRIRMNRRHALLTPPINSKKKNHTYLIYIALSRVP